MMMVTCGACVIMANDGVGFMVIPNDGDGVWGLCVDGK